MIFFHLKLSTLFTVLSRKDASLIQEFFMYPLVCPNPPAVNSNGIKTLLANSLTTFFIKENPVFNNGLKIYLQIPPDSTILTAEFLIILYYLLNYLQKFYKSLKLIISLLDKVVTCDRLKLTND